LEKDIWERTFKQKDRFVAKLRERILILEEEIDGLIGDVKKRVNSNFESMGNDEFEH